MNEAIKNILDRSKTLSKVGALARRPDFHLIIDATSFLPDNAKVAQRLWHIENSIWKRMTCPCGKKVNWSRDKKRYQTYCSSKCSYRYGDVQKRKEKTNIRKYGSISPFGNESVQEKAKQTNLKRYGADNPTKSRKIAQKVADTWNDKSSTEKNEIKKKTEKTNKEKYGVKNVFENNVVKQKIKESNLKKLGCESPLQNKTIYKKVQETNLKMYDAEHNWSSNSSVRYKCENTTIERYGCSNFSHVNMSTKVLGLLNNASYLTDEHHQKKKTLDAISKELNVSDTTIRRYFKKHGLEVKHFGQSQPERDITQLLEDHDIHPQTNVRNIIPPLELDIYIPEHNLAIEYCGLYWHSDIRLDKNYHKTKMDRCSKKGIRLLTIFEDEWIQKRHIVESKILSLLQLDKSPSVFARKCSIALVSTKTKRNFFNEYHIQGDGPSSINLGLIYEDNLVACMGFISRKNRTFELNRYATSGKVPGGFSKLLSYFKSTQEWCTISSFADLRWSQGNLYEKCGFELHTTAKPDYSYSPDGNTRHHKFNFRRKNLQKILPGFDPRLTEFENCDNHGILRIWDCGKKRYTLTNHCS